MNPRFYFACAVTLLLCGLAHAQTTDQVPRTRGALLYENHCGTCHSKELHWREKRLAKDWTSLAYQVRRWQDNAGLNWTGEDIGAVAEHLNERFYRYPR